MASAPFAAPEISELTSVGTLRRAIGFSITILSESTPELSLPPWLRHSADAAGHETLSQKTELDIIGVLLLIPRCLVLIMILRRVGRTQAKK